MVGLGLASMKFGIGFESWHEKQQVTFYFSNKSLRLPHTRNRAFWSLQTVKSLGQSSSLVPTGEFMPHSDVSNPISTKGGESTLVMSIAMMHLFFCYSRYDLKGQCNGWFAFNLSGLHSLLGWMMFYSVFTTCAQLPVIH